MKIIQIISFILFILGFSIKFNITPYNFIEDILNIIKDRTSNNKLSLREKIKKVKTSRKETYIERLINETKNIMANNGTIGSFNKIIITSIFLAIIGIIISIIINNIFILPIITILLALIPFYYIKIQSAIYKQEIRKELESALSSITSSYMKYNTTFIEAVKENIDSINNPLKNIFNRFIFTTEHINPNIKDNLIELKKSINHQTFQEWVDGIIASEEDYNLKATLPNITNKFTDMRIINNELTTKLYAPLKDYIYMVILNIVCIPLLYLFNKEAVRDYLNLPLGKIEIAIIMLIIIYTTIKVLNETRPTEYGG